MLSALLLVISLAGQSPPAANVQELIAPVRDAYAQVEARHSKLPPSQDDKDKLERLLELDQAGRAAISKMALSTLTPDDRKAAIQAAMKEIEKHDLKSQIVLKDILARDGWIVESKYGENAAKSAFLIVQHATNDPAFMRRSLEMIKHALDLKQVRPNAYALLADRIALAFDGKPQIYGTQVDCRSGTWAPFDVLDPANLDVRRQQIGLKTEAEYLKNFADEPCR